MTDKIFTTWVVLSLVTVVTRVGPLFIPSRLQDHPWMNRIASQLPLMILILLVFHDTEARLASEGASFLATLTGIAVTLLIHRWKRQAIVSIAAGVVAYALTSLFV